MARDVIAEIKFYVQNREPREAVHAWWDTLTEAERAAAMDYLWERMSSFIPAWQAFAESMGAIVRTITEDITQLMEDWPPEFLSELEVEEEHDEMAETDQTAPHSHLWASVP